MLWGDIATWVTALATCVTGFATILLFLIGFWQIRNERLSRIKSEHAQEIRQNRSQAELVSCWIAKQTFDETWVAVMNNSSQPIYQVIISRVKMMADGSSYGEYTDAGVIGVAIAPSGMQVVIEIAPPGTGYINLPQYEIGMHHRTGFEVGFIDASGRNWSRKPTGELIQINETPIMYYKVPLPNGWNNLTKELPPNEIESINNL